jgi:hypothetical protein
MFSFDSDWNPCTDLQAHHRLGGPNTCQLIFRFITEKGKQCTNVVDLSLILMSSYSSWSIQHQVNRRVLVCQHLFFFGIYDILSHVAVNHRIPYEQARIPSTTS